MEASEKQLRLEKSNWQVITATLGLLILLFFWLSLYAQPFADDFAYVRKVMDRGYWGAMGFDYQTWNGRFTSNLLVFLNPLTAGTWLYKICSALMLVATLRVFWVVLKKVIDNNRQQRTVATLLLTLTYLALQPTIAEGIYWYTGSVTYHLGNLLMLMTIYWLSSPKTKTVGWISLFLCLGFNEVQTAIIALFACLSFVGNKWRLIELPRWSIALLVTGIALMVLSPGNSGRSSNFENNMDVLNSLSMASLQTFRFAGTWLITPFFWIYLLILIVLPFQLQPKFKEWFDSKPGWWFMLVAFAGIFLCTFLPYLGTGILGQHRTLTTAEFLFVIWGGILALKYKQKILAKVPWMTWAINPLPVMILFGLIIAGNGFFAVTDLVTGNASMYDQQCEKRLLEAEQAQGQNQSFLPLSAHPYSLFSLDLTKDSTHWINQNFAIVNGLNSVVLEPTK